MKKREDYRYEFVPGDVFFPLFRQHRNKLFSDTITIDPRGFYSEEETQKIETLGETVRQHVVICLIVYDKEELIAWSFGEQKEKDSFYMVNSAVYPEYRRQGIYNKMLQMMMNKAVETGFQRVTSRHHTSNNAVIIPKLKAGFVISGIEVSDTFGTLVTLVYFSNKLRNDLFRYRVGEIKSLPDNVNH